MFFAGPSCIHPQGTDRVLDFLVGHRTEHHTVRRSTGWRWGASRVPGLGLYVNLSPTSVQACEMGQRCDKHELVNGREPPRAGHDGSCSINRSTGMSVLFSLRGTGEAGVGGFPREWGCNTKLCSSPSHTLGHEDAGSTR